MFSIAMRQSFLNKKKFSKSSGQKYSRESRNKYCLIFKIKGFQ